MEAKPRNSKRESPIKEFTGLDYTAIAEELEVTPQLLRVWKTEQELATKTANI